MSRFCGTVQGERGGAKTSASPQYVSLNGWDSGVRVRPTYMGDRKHNVDAFEVYMTFGSNGAGNDVKIGTVVCTPQGPVWVPDGEEMSADAYTGGA